MQVRGASYSAVFSGSVAVVVSVGAAVDGTVVSGASVGAGESEQAQSRIRESAYRIRRMRFMFSPLNGFFFILS